MKLLTLIFAALLITVFGKLLWLAVKATWGITKILFTIILLPIVLIVIAASGFLSIAFLGLIVIGLFSLIDTIR